MLKKIIISSLIVGCVGTNFYAYSTPLSHTKVQKQNISTNLESNEISNPDLNYNIRACMGQQSWSSFAWSVTMEAAGFLPAGKVQKLYDKIYLVVTKAYQVGTRDWESLCWTVVDVVCAFVPGAVPIKVFWSICKLTPSF